VELTRAGGDVPDVMDDHRQEREIELGVGGGDRLRGAGAVVHSRVRAVALRLHAHLLRRLDGDDAGVERIGQQDREAPRAGPEIEDGQA